ncbi:hypothetical protein Thimo_0351 [Thioflavicoccus mobilis 8321]|uniref:Uncharacterized protein n=1 Tax=Thioflavicoccus mobilis 8321 TaxID=765912 RepID=L0GV26_9GAMM|nr:hypothetical protein [Thioflavicoccus mobilis]AGA89220.1 hypothetical protein Thimo_0351 [Thioflavicoccus mobilis 8321]
MSGRTTQPLASTSDLQQLNQTVASLAEALARSERRHAHLARTMRWGALGLFSLLILAGFMIADRAGLAFAQSPGGSPQATTTVEALNNIDANLMVLGAMGQAMQAVTPAIQQAVDNNPDVQAYMQRYFKEHGLNPAPEQQAAYAQQALMESLVGTVIDSIVLVQRIRQDSNAFRELVTGPDDVLRDIEGQLDTMNRAMLSIPIMAAQMDAMNRNMAAMSYSMGSTMGRVGNWMPW